MSWNPIRRLSEVSSSSEPIGAGGWLFFRDIESLRAFAPGASAPTWSFEDPACVPFGCRRTVLAEGLVISVMDHGGDGAVRIVALEPERGEVAWKCTLKLELGIGALAAEEGLLRIAGADKKRRRWLVTLEARSGKELSRVPAPWAHTLISIQGKTFFVGGDSISVISKKDDAPRQILEGEVFFPSADSRSLYFSLGKRWQGPVSVVRLDARTEKVLHSRKAPKDFQTISEIIPLDEAGRVALISDGVELGMPAPALMDLTSNKPPVRVKPRPKSWITAGCRTDSGLALLHVEGSSSEVVLHDPVKGRALQVLGAHAHRPRSVFQVERSLIVVGGAGLVFREGPSGDPRLLEPEAATEVVPVRRSRPAREPKPSRADAKRAKELVALVQLFARCMTQLGKNNKVAHRTLAQEFNARFTAFLAANAEESVGTFAMRLKQAGIPYKRAFTDLISVRSMGMGTPKPARKSSSPRKGKPRSS
jgi:hypothetical protein